MSNEPFDRDSLFRPSAGAGPWPTLSFRLAGFLIIMGLALLTVLVSIAALVATDDVTSGSSIASAILGIVGAILGAGSAARASREGRLETIELTMSSRAAELQQRALRETQRAVRQVAQSVRMHHDGPRGGELDASLNRADMLLHEATDLERTRARLPHSAGGLLAWLTAFVVALGLLFGAVGTTWNTLEHTSHTIFGEPKVIACDAQIESGINLLERHPAIAKAIAAGKSLPPTLVTSDTDDECGDLDHLFKSAAIELAEEATPDPNAPDPTIAPPQRNESPASYRAVNKRPLHRH